MPQMHLHWNARECVPAGVQALPGRSPTPARPLSPLIGADNAAACKHSTHNRTVDGSVLWDATVDRQFHGHIATTLHTVRDIHTKLLVKASHAFPLTTSILPWWGVMTAVRT